MLYKFITVPRAPVKVKVYVAVMLGENENTLYLTTLPAKEAQDVVTVLNKARLVVASPATNVPEIVRGELYWGLSPRSRAAFPASAITVSAGATTAPSAPQPEVILIFAALILKKILPIDLTMILPLDVTCAGITTFSVPSLAVEFISV